MQKIGAMRWDLQRLLASLYTSGPSCERTSSSATSTSLGRHWVLEVRRGQLRLANGRTRNAIGRPAGFSVVKLASDRTTGVEYACKIMALPPVGQEVGENENTR